MSAPQETDRNRVFQRQGCRPLRSVIWLLLQRKLPLQGGVFHFSSSTKEQCVVVFNLDHVILWLTSNTQSSASEIILKRVESKCIWTELYILLLLLIFIPYVFSSYLVLIVLFCVFFCIYIICNIFYLMSSSRLLLHLICMSTLFRWIFRCFYLDSVAHPSLLPGWLVCGGLLSKSDQAVTWLSGFPALEVFVSVCIFWGQFLSAQHFLGPSSYRLARAALCGYARL